jgi:predicted lipase
MVKQFDITNKFTQKNCYYAALFSKAVYNKDEIKSLAAQFGMKCKVYPVENHFAAICYNTEFAVIAYRGTNDKKDWKTNLEYITRRFPASPAEVHKGFDTAYNLLSIKMHELLHKLYIASRVKWIVTGHSMGGGIATRHVYGLKNPNGHCYTFGSPRVGNQAFINGISTPITRVINGDDLVTKFPLKKMRISGLEFRHPSQHVINLNYDGTITIGARDLWGKIKERVHGLASDIIDTDLIPDNIEDHGMEGDGGYCEILSQWEGA